MSRNCFAVLCLAAASAWGQEAAPKADAPKPPDPIATLVGRLNLEKYKATIKELTRFGDRRQGTDRNRAALDWIEAQLKSYGCPTERLSYEYAAPVGPRPVNRAGADPRFGPGGARKRGMYVQETVNNDPMKQPDEKIREINAQKTEPGRREEVFCTKVGTAHPGEMYLVAAHFDGQGYGEAANDDGSGTALVMELARVFSAADVQTDRTIRFALWNNEETGLNGARAYVAARKDLQGKESPAGSGKYPEPKWLGMIQHDMLMFDHGMPRKDGTVSKEQRPEADINVEYQITAQMADAALKLGQTLQFANEKYATDYPANLTAHMTNTDSTPFMDLVAAVSVREAERGSQIGSGWDPHHHQPTDVFTTFSDDDFRLGLNAAQTTLSAVGQLAGAHVAGASAGTGN
jgi:hypothetical protein